MQPLLIVHGGAGDIPQSRVQGKLDGVKTAVIAGYQILERGGSALDAVEAAVVSMEKDEYFNAGMYWTFVFSKKNSENVIEKFADVENWLWTILLRMTSS